MLRVSLLVFCCLFFGCGKSPSPDAYAQKIIPAGHLYLATQDSGQQSYLYRFNIPANDRKALQEVVTGDDIQMDSPVALSFDEENNELYLAKLNSIVVLKIDGSSLTPQRIIGGASTGLTQISDLKYYNHQLYVLNQNDNSLLIFDALSQGNIVPLRRIQGTDTLLDAPSAVEVTEDFILVLNSGATASVVTFLESDQDNISPQRILNGNLTNLITPKGMAVNSSDQQIYISNGDDSILFFNLTDQGNVGYQKRIKGAQTQINGATHLIYDELTQSLLVCNQSGRGVISFPIKAWGNMPPSYDISGFETPRAMALVRHK